MPGHFQGIFRRYETYVVVRPIKAGPNGYLAPGTEISRADFPIHRLQHWHRRRRIGAKGTLWVETMLKHEGKPNLRPEITERPSRKASEPDTEAVTKKPRGRPRKRTEVVRG